METGSTLGVYKVKGFLGRSGDFARRSNAITWVFKWPIEAAWAVGQVPEISRIGFIEVRRLVATTCSGFALNHNPKPYGFKAWRFA